MLPILVRYCRPLEQGHQEVGAQFMIDRYFLHILGGAIHELKQDGQVFGLAAENPSFAPSISPVPPALRAH